MSHLIWSPSALADVQRLYRFLALNDTDTAKYAIKIIRAGVKILARQPEVGRPVEDMLPVFREWPINFGRSGYTVLYRYDGKVATILAVRHQKEAGYYDKSDR